MAAALAASSFGAATAQAAPATSTTVEYLALGDSYPAGTGLLADPSHPALLGSVNYANVGAASSATLGDTTALVLADLNTARTGNDVVTVTVGANDVDWLGAIFMVQQGATQDQLVGYLQPLLLALGASGIPLVVTAAAGANDGATILVTGYPHLFGDASKGCFVTPLGAANPVSVTADQAALVDGAIDLLNSTIATSVANAGSYAPGANVAFVDVVPTFKGHGVCDSTPWLQNGSSTGPIAFHPNARGQKAYAQAIQKDGFQKTALNVSRAK